MTELTAANKREEMEEVEVMNMTITGRDQWKSDDTHIVATIKRKRVASLRGVSSEADTRSAPGSTHTPNLRTIDQEG